MYLFCAVPVGATKLAFTFLNSAAFDFVLLTTSESVEAIEPDWVEHTECLGGVYEAYLIDDVLRSVSGVSSAKELFPQKPGSQIRPEQGQRFPAVRLGDAQGCG